ncbi:MAG: hypothetical protein COT17_06080 [Elusimicrobia bacterium CG08_land_8_20_14_0_20_51_18]|nr:MAG: hypothetical protein COT17_06080 [Elusimicrobia bacterium CG08_land_8_20_14_0_20_51_18]
MKLEIKKITLMSVMFSAFSLMIFFTSLFIAVAGIFIVPNPVWIPVNFLGRVMGAGLYTLTLFVITMAYVIFLVFVYNFFVGVIGMKGLTLKMEEVPEQE